MISRIYNCITSFIWSRLKIFNNLRYSKVGKLEVYNISISDNVWKQRNKMLNILLNEGKSVFKVVEIYETVISKLHNIHWNSRDNPTQLLLFWAYAISSLQTLMHFLWKFIQEYRYKKTQMTYVRRTNLKLKSLCPT